MGDHFKVVIASLPHHTRQNVQDWDVLKDNIGSTEASEIARDYAYNKGIPAVVVNNSTGVVVSEYYLTPPPM